LRKPILVAAGTLLIGLALFAAVGLSAFDLDDRHQCADAKRLADVGLLAKARERYKALLEEDPNRDCAEQGFVDVATRECRAARSLLDSGALAKAAAIYERLASESERLQPRPECSARVGLRDVIRRSCSNVNPLIVLSRFGEAEKRFIAILEEHPHARCAADGLRRLIQMRCVAAAQLAAANLLAEAKAAFGTILDSDSTAACAIQGLKELSESGDSA
jgi:tetratricopeptide (TPR) repeat protein